MIDKEEREDYYLFGEKIKISAEGNEFYQTDRGDYIKKERCRRLEYPEN